MKIRLLKNLKILLVLLLLLIIVTPNISFAASESTIKFSDAQEFINRGKDGDIGLKQNDLNNIGNQFSHIAKLLRYIGTGILVGALSYMGIKYMMASPDQQAKLKQQLIGLVVAAVVIFASYMIWETVYNFFSAIDG